MRAPARVLPACAGLRFFDAAGIVVVMTEPRPPALRVVLFFDPEVAAWVAQGLELDVNAHGLTEESALVHLRVTLVEYARCHVVAREAPKEYFHMRAEQLMKCEGSVKDRVRYVESAGWMLEIVRCAPTVAA